MLLLLLLPFLLYPLEGRVFVSYFMLLVTMNFQLPQESLKKLGL